MIEGAWFGSIFNKTKAKDKRQMQTSANPAALSTQPTTPIYLDIVIPTLGRRNNLFDVIEQLRGFANRTEQVRMRVIVSFNPKTPKAQTVYLDGIQAQSKNFTLEWISPERYQDNSEEHLLWLMDWYHRQAKHPDAYVWALTDYDPIIDVGFDALVDFISNDSADIFYMNNLWGDTLGELLPSLSVRSNVKVWRGPLPDFFTGIGFAHATTCIGTLFIKSSFLDEVAIQSFRDIFARSEVNAHAWWGFELAARGSFAFLATPVVMNKFNRHNFDHAPTWKEATMVKQQASKWPWIVGYLIHLDLYMERGMLTPLQLKTAIISEAQRGILLFMDEIIRQLEVQMKLGLRNASERFNASDVALIRKVFRLVFPLRMPMIDAMCEVLDKRLTDPKERLLAYKRATKFRYTEAGQGEFSPLFFGSAYGWAIHQHRVGYVAVLRKGEIFKAYRDLDPFDLDPLILFAKTELEIREKIDRARATIRPDWLRKRTVLSDGVLKRGIRFFIECSEAPDFLAFAIPATQFLATLGDFENKAFCDAI